MGEEETWDIDTDSSAYAYEAVLDSGLGRSEDGHALDLATKDAVGLGIATPGAATANGFASVSGTASPMRRGPTLLDLPG